MQQFVDDSTMLRVGHIPAIARMCHRLGLIDLINESIPCNTDIDLGTLVTGIICDTLSGRSPLYKVQEFIAEQDTELLFGTAVNSHSFNDDALGHALDRIHQKGTLKLITAENLKPLSDLLFISRFPTTYHCPHDAAKALQALTRKNKIPTTTSSAAWHKQPFTLPVGYPQTASEKSSAPNTTTISAPKKTPFSININSNKPAADVSSGSVNILKHGQTRHLPHNGIKPQGLNYLEALGFDQSIYTTPPPPSKTQRRP